MTKSDWKDVRFDPPSPGVYIAANDEDVAICGYWPHMDQPWGTLESDRSFEPKWYMEIPAKPEA